MKKIILAFDSFKGCMTSREANEAAAKGIASVSAATVQTESFCVSDGGEGFLEAMKPDEVVTCHVHDALKRWTDAAFGIKNGVAIIEVAQAVGLSKVEPEQRNPLHATSFGVGELMVQAMRRGCRSFIVGLGGSATSDCGLGMLQCLKHEWQVEHNKPWYEPFDTSSLRSLKVTLATDVRNPLCGDEGAARVFAPQKGADAKTVEMLERRAVTFANMAAKHQGYDKRNNPGAGAAGGLGFAFMEFMDAKVESGGELVLRTCGFDDALSDAALIITGEGSSDRQTLMGKLPSVILQQGLLRHVPVVLMSGRIDDKAELLSKGFSQVVCINEGLSLDDAMEKDVARHRLAACARRVVTPDR